MPVQRHEGNQNEANFAGIIVAIGPLGARALAERAGQTTGTVRGLVFTAESISGLKSGVCECK
jgi:hypothetical protein